MKKMILAGMLCVCASLILICLYQNGWITFNRPNPVQYPVQGIDVSEYQGDIDWKVLSNQGFAFAFIKATEGSSYQDPKFTENWQDAHDNGFLRGAYHFFSFDSSGERQAEHFISVVPNDLGMLPPVIDVELYGKYKRNPPPKEKVLPELNNMLSALESHYQTKPILYATELSYKKYLTAYDQTYPIWIRNVICQPRMTNARWTFWQYSDKGSIPGFEGPEQFIDLNVFYGSEEEWDLWLADRLDSSNLYALKSS